MGLNIVSDDEVVIKEDTIYIKMSTRRKIVELYIDIISNSTLIKTFYTKLEQNMI